MKQSAPVNVALVIDTLHRGGAERVLVAIANGLDRDRYRVHVILTRNRGPLANDLAAHVNVHSLERRSRRDVLALRRFSRLIRDHDIQIVHTHSHSAAYFARLARILDRASWLHVMHDHHGPVEGSYSHRLADRLLLRNVDHYLAVSSRLEAYAERWLGISRERREYLCNGVPVPTAAAHPPAVPFTVAHVARLMPDKNQKMALMVARSLRESMPDLRWLLVGRTSSSYGDECARLVVEYELESNVVFLGEQAEVGKFLSAAHVGVVTSDFEGLPLALLEYMAAGLPVVVTDVGECASVVRASGGGVVVPPGDVEGFSKALLDYAANPSAASRAGDLNRRFVAENHSVAAMVRRISDVYEALLAGDQNVTSYSRRAVGSV